MGAGKSTVGRALADRLGWSFVDTDAVLAARHGPIAAQIRDEGEATFRRREAAVVREVRGPSKVIATGGGVFADPDLRRALGEHCWLVTLDADLDLVRARVGGDADRPLLGQAASLLQERAPHYLDVDHRVSADAPVADLVEALAAWLSTARDVPVPLPGQAYAVQIRDRLGPTLGHAVRRTLDPERVVLVTESTVGPLWADVALTSLRAAGIEVGDPVVLPAGEARKDLETWRMAVEGLLAAGADRHTPVVALGGGVLGDIAGFAGATALRGLPLVQVPTTLLAMVDSSVGGKTGVNHVSGKNRIGAFHQPALVVAALDTLTTLEARAARSGLAEVVKAALIGDEGLWERLQEQAEVLGRLQPQALAEVVADAVRVKAEVVVDDVLERGRRATLNLGHTAGHALETALGHGVLHHGEAVAIGLVAEAAWAARAGLGPSDLPDALRACLARMELPTQAPPVSSTQVIAAMRVDKKRRGAMLRQPVCVRPGRVDLVDLPVSALGDLVADLMAAAE